MNGICIHCGKSIKPNPRVKNQRYCSEKACQRARRASWQRQKMANDPDYRRIRKDAKGIGITATLDIIRNTGISILSIPKGIMPCSRSAMRSGVTTNKVK